MRRGSLIHSLLLAALALASPLPAHEGHEHTVMGKVVAIDDKRIEVETTEGKRVTAALSSDTKYSRDKSPAQRADVKVGERVVIFVVENADHAQNVTQVRLGPAQPPGQQR